MAPRRRYTREQSPETLVINGKEHFIDKDVLECRSGEALSQLHAQITAQLVALRLEQQRLVSAMLQEQSRALELHQQLRRLEDECRNAAARMPKDQWSFFRSTTSEEVRQRTLGPHWRRMKEIKDEGELLGIKYRRGGSPYDQVGYLFFDAPAADYKTQDGLGPPRDWTQYEATTKSQRLLPEHEKTLKRFAKVEKRVAVVIKKHTRDELREAKRIERARIKKEREQREKERHEELRAAAAANAEEVRRQADRLRVQLGGQRYCPYCGEQLGDVVHVDHIYPVSKGGRSVGRNLVKTCVECNQKKGNHTLAQFIRACGLDREEIEKRLSELGKDF